jgi:hypothetical protein
LFSKLAEFSILYDYAIVRSTLLKSDAQEIIHVNIRSEMATTTNLTEVFKNTLIENGTFTEESYELGIKLLDSLITGNTKDILNQKRSEYLC